jgi:hypothetical protein
MILGTKVSYFSNTRDTEVKKDVLIFEILDSIKNGAYKDIVNKVRSGDSEQKKRLPTVAMHGRFRDFRKKNDFIEASGLIILDIDDIEDDLEEVKQDIMDSTDHVLAAMISPSGNGVKVLYYVQPEIVNQDSYRQIGKQLVDEFSIYGHVDYLSVTDCLIMTYDPYILVNKDVWPAMVYLKEVATQEVELEKLDDTRNLWEDPEDFFDTVLAEDISQKTNNNFHYIQVALLDLAKFGFYHPKEDLSFVIDYAESAFKYSPENKKRFQEAAQIANEYPQLKWPYKFERVAEEEEPYLDYSDYMSNEESDVPKDEESDGFINPQQLKSAVIETVKEGDRVGDEISLSNFADVFRFKGTGVLTITGIPGHGKTEWTDQLIIDLARLHMSETLVVGYEQTPQEHIIKLIRKMVGTDITCPSWFVPDNMDEFDEAYDFITEMIHHLDATSVGGNINTILEKLAQKIKELRARGKNPKYVVIDPFNMLSIKGRFSGHEKVEEIFRRITHFSHQMKVMVILIAHPFKMGIDEKTGEYKVPDFYSVKGSSVFFEMSYHGLTVYRKLGVVMIKVLKVKQNNLGEREAEVFFEYDRPSGRYIPVDEESMELEGDHRDRDWLQKALKLKEQNE